MNIKEILTKQIELNDLIIKHHELHDKNYQDQQLLALIVEVSELANEIQHFKYWKKNINTDQQKILEEYADGIHFYLSFGVDLGIGHEFKEIIFSENMTAQFLEIYNSILIFSKKWDLDSFNYSFSLFLGLGKILNFNEQQIIDAYLKKNIINFQRIENKY